MQQNLFIEKGCGEEASLVVSNIIVEVKNRLSDGEYIKECILKKYEISGQKIRYKFEKKI